MGPVKDLDPKEESPQGYMCSGCRAVQNGAFKYVKGAS